MKKHFLFYILGAISIFQIAFQSKAESIQYKDYDTGFVYIINTDDNTAGVYGGTSLTGDVTVPDEVSYEGKQYQVTEILETAFISNSKITSITTGPNLKVIGTEAFKSAKIQNITLSAVEVIGDKAFVKCTELQSVDLGNSLKTIGAEAFGEDAALIDEFVIPASVTEIGANPWYSCTGLTSIASDSNLFSTIDGVLYSADGKNLLAYPAGKKDASFSVPQTVTTLAESCFRGSVFTSVLLPEGLTTMGEKCLYKSNLTSLSIPASVDSIGMMAITNSRDLESIEINASNKSFKYNDGYLTSYDGKRLIFSQWREGELEIPEGIETVDDYTFFEMSGLTDVTFPSSMRELGELAFYNCAALSSIDFGDGIQKVGRMCFQNCKKLTSVKIPASMRELGLQAFCYDEKISTLTIAEGLEKIGDSAFLGCTSIRRVTLPSTIKEWGAAIFYQCTRLMVAKFGEGTTVVPDQMFNYDTNLYDVTLPNTVKTIERASFYNTKVTDASFTWPEQLDSIGFSAFYGTSFVNIEFPENLRVIGEWAFAYSPSIETVKLGENVKSILDLAFAKDTKLREIELNEGLETIGMQAFSYCEAMPNIVLPSTIENIGKEAFSHMTELESIQIKNPVPPVLSENIVMDEEYDEIKLIVPGGSVDAYKAAPIWKRFQIVADTSEVQEISTDVVEPVEAYMIDGTKASIDTKGILIVRYSDGSTRKIHNK